MKAPTISLNRTQRLSPTWTLLGFFVLFLSFAVLSCQEDNPVGPIDYRDDFESDSLVEYEYRIDNSLSQSFAVTDADSVSIYLIEIGLPSQLENYTKTIIHKFTEKSEYYDYADSKDVLAEEFDLIQDSLVYLAELYNMDSIFAVDDSIPDWWFEREADVMEEFLGFTEHHVLPRGFMSQLNDNWRNQCRGLHNEGNNQIYTLPLIGIPVLGWLGWRNRVSGLMPLFLGGFDNVYQRSFYRRRLATIWRPGLVTTDFCGPLLFLNNNSNSWLSFGI